MIPSVVSSSVCTVAFSVARASLTPCSMPAESTSLRRVVVSSFTKRASVSSRCRLPSACDASPSPTLRELHQRVHQRLHGGRRRLLQQHVTEVAGELCHLLHERESFLCVSE